MPVNNADDFANILLAFIHENYDHEAVYIPEDAQIWFGLNAESFVITVEMK